MTRMELVKKGQARAISVAEGAINPMAPAGFLRFYYQGQEFEVAEPEWAAAFATHNEWALKDHEQVIAAGGLFILGTERHESRRIDNQLRGRAGRQGDPGESRFYLSLEDDLMRIFAKQWVSVLLEKLGMEEGVPIESRMISNRIEAAQKAVEAQNFESRKHLLEYDDVMNKQRQAVYGMRRGLLEGVDQKARVLEMTKGVVGGIIDRRCPTNAHPENYDITDLQTDMLTQFGVRINPATLAGLNGDQIEVEIYEKAEAAYQAKEDLVGASLMREAERNIMLHVIDDQWKDHLLSMDHLKEGIGLRGYGQKDPLVEYKKESYTLFTDMMDRIEDETVRYLYFLRFEQNPGALPFANDDSEYEEDEEAAERKKLEVSKALEEQQRLAAQSAVQDMTRGIQKQHERELKELQFAGTNGSTVNQPVANGGPKTGRNDPCPCGSGKKFKKCHGA
jgi:preprotein translocase subunit SecA